MTEYYICPSLAATGNEGTLTNPFRASGIPWGSLVGGDILSFLEVFDGISSYAEYLSVGASGEIDNPIILRTAPGESNFALFDGNNATDCIKLYNRNWIKIVNLAATRSTHYGIEISFVNNVEVDDCKAYSNNRGIGGNTGSGDIHHVKITNNKCYFNAEEGLQLYGGVHGNYIYDVVCENNESYENKVGITITCDSTGALNSKIIINNNIFRDNARGGLNLSTTDGRVGYNSVSNNQVYNNGAAPDGENANGIWLGNISNTIIEHNKCYNNATGFIDGIGIFLDYQHGIGSYHNIVRYNECYNHNSNFQCIPFAGGLPQANSAGIGICCGAHDNDICFNLSYENALGIYVGGEGSSNNKIYHNTIFGNRIGIHDRCKTLPGTIYKNNIVFDNTLTGGGETFTRDIYRPDSGVVEITEDYNCFPEIPSFSNHSIGENSLMQDPLLSSNGMLQSETPCLYAGIKISGVNFVGRRGYFGTIYKWPNIGADQRQPWIFDGCEDRWSDIIFL